MKNNTIRTFLSLFTLVIINTSLFSQQQQYTFETTSKIYDIPGDYFLVYRTENNKLHMREIALNGSVVWEDSISFSTPQGTIDNVIIDRFKNTTNLGIFLQDNLVDSVVISSYCLSTLSHTFLATGIDTIYSEPYLNTCAYNDTTILLFSHTTSSDTVNHATYTVSPSMDMLEIAQADSVISVPQFGKSYFYSMNDSIYQLHDLYGNVNSRHYNAQMSEQSAFTSPSPSQYDFSGAIYRQPKNADSLFCFRYAYKFATDTNIWVMSWLNHELEIINEIHMPFSTMTTYYGLNWGYVAFRDDHIVLLAGSGGPSVVNENFIFEYDFDFNLICMYKINPSVGNTDQLIELNGKTYFQRDTGSNLEMYIVDQCSFASSETFIQEMDVEVYPNPFNDYLTIDHCSNQSTITLYDLSGKILIQSYCTTGDAKLDVQQINPGIYLLEIANAESIKRTQVVKN